MSRPCQAEKPAPGVPQLTQSLLQEVTHTHPRNREKKSEILVKHTEWALRRVKAWDSTLLGCTWEGFLEEPEMEERMTREQQLEL